MKTVITPEQAIKLYPEAYLFVTVQRQIRDIRGGPGTIPADFLHCAGYASVFGINEDLSGWHFPALPDASGSAIKTTDQIIQVFAADTDPKGEGFDWSFTKYGELDEVLSRSSALSWDEIMLVLGDGHRTLRVAVWEYEKVVVLERVELPILLLKLQQMKAKPALANADLQKKARTPSFRFYTKSLHHIFFRDPEAWRFYTSAQI